jgi:hypothetical protein
MYRISKSRAVAHEIVFKRHYEESDLAVGRPVASSDPGDRDPGEDGDARRQEAVPNSRRGRGSGGLEDKRLSWRRRDEVPDCQRRKGRWGGIYETQLRGDLGWKKNA